MMMFKRLVKLGNILSLSNGKLLQNGRLLSENGRPETIAKNGSFPAKTGRLESLSNTSTAYTSALILLAVFGFGSQDFYHSLYSFVVSNDYAPMPPSLTDFSGVGSSREKLRKQDGQCFRLNSRQ